MVLVLRVMRWLILHSSGDRQTLTLEKRQLIQVSGMRGARLSMEAS